MPTLREALGMLAATLKRSGVAVAPEHISEIERAWRGQWPGERIYLPPPDSRKNGERTEAIRRAAARLPTGVVAERFGVSRQWVVRVVRRSDDET